MRSEVLLKLAAVFVPFSLAAFGGTPSIFASIQHQAVDVQHWVTAHEFVEAFVVARAAPGPGSMLVTLVGWKADGWAGALVATIAIYLPASLVTLAVAKVWNRYRGRSWHAAVQEGLAPVAVGLILSGIFAVFRVAGAGPLSWCTAIASAAVMGIWPKLNLFVLLMAGGALFVLVDGLARD